MSSASWLESRAEVWLQPNVDLVPAEYADELRLATHPTAVTKAEFTLDQTHAAATFDHPLTLSLRRVGANPVFGAFAAMLTSSALLRGFSYDFAAPPRRRLKLDAHDAGGVGVSIVAALHDELATKFDAMLAAALARSARHGGGIEDLAAFVQVFEQWNAGDRGPARPRDAAARTLISALQSRPATVRGKLRIDGQGMSFSASPGGGSLTIPAGATLEFTIIAVPFGLPVSAGELGARGLSPELNVERLSVIAIELYCAKMFRVAQPPASISVAFKNMVLAPRDGRAHLHIDGNQLTFLGADPEHPYEFKLSQWQDAAMVAGMQLVQAARQLQAGVRLSEPMMDEVLAREVRTLEALPEFRRLSPMAKIVAAEQFKISRRAEIDARTMRGGMFEGAAAAELVESAETIDAVVLGHTDDPKWQSGPGLRKLQQMRAAAEIDDGIEPLLLRAVIDTCAELEPQLRRDWPMLDLRPLLTGTPVPGAQSIDVVGKASHADPRAVLNLVAPSR